MQKQLTAHDTNTATVPLSTDGYEFVVVSALGLAGAEEVPINIVLGGTEKQVTNTSGTAQKLTATIVTLQLAGGPTYSLTKPATASAASLYADFHSER